VRGYVEPKPKAAVRRSHVAADSRRAVSQLRLRAADRHVEAPAGVDVLPGKRRVGPDDDRVRPRLAAKGVERSRRNDPEPAPLSGREPPEPGVAAELAA